MSKRGVGGNEGWLGGNKGWLRGNEGGVGGNEGCVGGNEGGGKWRGGGGVYTGGRSGKSGKGEYQRRIKGCKEVRKFRKLDRVWWVRKVPRESERYVYILYWK